jgi:hypothetical protein
MNTLLTHAQGQTWMRLTRQQLLGIVVLLALLAALAFALLGVGYYASEQAYSADSFAPIAGAPRCPRGCI